jgi:hypothetical protein
MHIRKLTVGTSVVAFDLSSYSGLQPQRHGVRIVAFGRVGGTGGNTGTIAVGERPTVTVNSADATDGYPLAAGDDLFLPVDTASLVNTLYFVADAAGQVVYLIID